MKKFNIWDVVVSNHQASIWDVWVIIPIPSTSNYINRSKIYLVLWFESWGEYEINNWLKSYYYHEDFLDLKKKKQHDDISFYIEHLS